MVSFPFILSQSLILHTVCDIFVVYTWSETWMMNDNVQFVININETPAVQFTLICFLYWINCIFIKCSSDGCCFTWCVIKSPAAFILNDVSEVVSTYFTYICQIVMWLITRNNNHNQLTWTHFTSCKRHKIETKSTCCSQPAHFEHWTFDFCHLFTCILLFAAQVDQ